jgi:hypothetical protein
LDFSVVKVSNLGKMAPVYTDTNRRGIFYE